MKEGEISSLYNLGSHAIITATAEILFLSISHQALSQSIACVAQTVIPVIKRHCIIGSKEIVLDLGLYLWDDLQVHMYMLLNRSSTAQMTKILHKTCKFLEMYIILNDFHEKFKSNDSKNAMRCNFQEKVMHNFLIPWFYFIF